MPFDYVFSIPPALMSPQPSTPGSAIAPAQGIDTSTGVGYINSGSGWVPQVPGTVLNLKKSAQSANIANTTLYAVPAHMGGMYQVSTLIKVTTVGSSNSTMPSVVYYWTDGGDNTLQSVTAVATATTNTVNTGGNATTTIYASGGTNIVYNISGYLSNGTAMAYEAAIRVTYLG